MWLICCGLRPSRVCERLRSALRLILNLPDRAQPAKHRCPVLDVKSAQLQMSGMSASKLHLISRVSHFDAAMLAKSDKRWRQLGHPEPARTNQQRSVREFG